MSTNVDDAASDTAKAVSPRSWMAALATGFRLRSLMRLTEQ